VDRERDTLQPDDLSWGESGLLPAVVQHRGTGEVLMLAWMDRTALERTLESGRAWFWSRSRQAYWMKGEESGNVLDVAEVRYDCDADSFLLQVDLHGEGACHTGERTCFYRTIPVTGASATAAAVLDQRKRELPEGSYTTQLLSGPQDKLLKKIAEEAGEVIIAARDGDHDQTRYEAADLLYHLLVVMAREGVSAEELAEELAGRFGRSGLR
jgi:phosphoribosyl-ATP pyrophosphohydrolase/phosphoribosyl-AMP cyclohydrolase